MGWVSMSQIGTWDALGLGSISRAALSNEFLWLRFILIGLYMVQGWG